MELQLVIDSLLVRKSTIEETLRKRQNNERDFSSWRFEPTQELEGRLKEIENTLNMLNVYNKT